MELTICGNTIFIQQEKAVLGNRDICATTSTEIGLLLWVYCSIYWQWYKAELFPLNAVNIHKYDLIFRLQLYE
jgi:hypothetical protein